MAIRTAKSRMIVNQVGQAANNVTGSSFSFFASGGEDFIKDASLIMGNSAQNLSWRIFESSQGYPGDPSNNYGWLYAQSNTTVDSTTFPSYRVAFGAVRTETRPSDLTLNGILPSTSIQRFLHRAL